MNKIISLHKTEHAKLFYFRRTWVNKVSGVAQEAPMKVNRHQSFPNLSFCKNNQNTTDL